MPESDIIPAPAVFVNRTDTLDATARRQVVRQGGLVKILRAGTPKRHGGGGKRAAQQGHGKRSERRLYNFLLTCKQPGVVIWLTYPDIRGPGKVEANIKAFLRRLEKHTGKEFGAISKMETQGRLSPEVTVAIWFTTDIKLNKHDVKSIWDKTIKADARIKVQKPRDWYALSSYMAKQVIVSPYDITIGAKKMTFTEPAASDFIIRAHKDDDPNAHILPLMDARYTGAAGAFLQIKEAWIQYKGRYSWKYGRARIPKHPKVFASVDVHHIERARQAVNAMRQHYFIGNSDYFTLKGGNASKFIRENAVLRGEAIIPPVLSPSGGSRGSSVMVYLEVCRILKVTRPAACWPEGFGLQ